MFGWLQRWIIRRKVDKLRKENPEMFDFLDGKKTFIVQIAQILTGAWLAMAVSPDPSLAFVPDVPVWLVSVLGALGIVTRAVAKPR